MVEFSDDAAVRLELRVIVGTHANQEPLGGEALSRRQLQAKFDLILRRRILQGIFLQHFGRAGGIHFIGANFRLSFFRTEMKTKNRQQTAGVESPNKETPPGSTVVNELDAHGPVHLDRRSFKKIMNTHSRPVFAEAVGKHAIATLRTA